MVVVCVGSNCDCYIVFFGYIDYCGWCVGYWVVEYCQFVFIECELGLLVLVCQVLCCLVGVCFIDFFVGFEGNINCVFWLGVVFQMVFYGVQQGDQVFFYVQCVVFLDKFVGYGFVERWIILLIFSVWFDWYDVLVGQKDDGLCIFIVVCLGEEQLVVVEVLWIQSGVYVGKVLSQKSVEFFKFFLVGVWIES